MAGYARKYTSRRRTTGSRRTGTRRNYGSKGRVSALRKPRFAMVGYTRDTEVKYRDKCIMSAGGILNVGNFDSGTGVKERTASGSSQHWGRANFGADMVMVDTNHQQDLLKGVPQGVNAGARVGNVINVKSVKARVSFAAAWVENTTSDFDNA